MFTDTTGCVSSSLSAALQCKMTRPILKLTVEMYSSETVIPQRLKLTIKHFFNERAIRVLVAYTEVRCQTVRWVQ